MKTILGVWSVNRKLTQPSVCPGVPNTFRVCPPNVTWSPGTKLRSAHVAHAALLKPCLALVNRCKTAAPVTWSACTCVSRMYLSESPSSSMRARSRSTISTTGSMRTPSPVPSSARRYVYATLSVKQLPENHVALHLSATYQQNDLPGPIAGIWQDASG